MKAYRETERKYYKCQYGDWTQPVKPVNGTLGGDTFAYTASHLWSSNYPLSNMFDNNISTLWATDGGGTYFITIYNPQQLNVTNVAVSNYSQFYASSATVYGSDDNINWIPLGSGVANSIVDGTWNVSLNENDKYFYYHKTVFIPTDSSLLELTGIKLTATKRTAEETTEEDYDFYKDIDTNTYKLLKIDEKYYGIGD